ncbi:hypothetical protein [Amycolatopsis sp. DSM 110486]|uniref:hypothetical protein n=1 Tax=Amycolatopsis sp. DSM 110486 TaxID=2865832 RepID=UPI001C695D6A|nr:hypothetical protein [Amycolatopsis sp. DSM 110486]QYN23150.1 hypothetical protein K1T34_12230 [Amycolatopsis sp. DSM 110486]
MNVFEVLERKGTLVLLGFLAALLGFVVLHLIRIPLVLLAAILAGVMARLNTSLQRLATEPARGPVNQFFPPNFPVTRKEPAHA